MKYVDALLEGYESTKLCHYKDLDESFPNTHDYARLADEEVTGVLKCSRYRDGKLLQIYSEKENHVGVIAGTRLGKTTSYVIPTVISFSRMKNKRSMLISDPKGEVYRLTAATLREEGYRVILLNFRSAEHSECWNPLTPIYRKYQEVFSIYDEVGVVRTEKGVRNTFRGKVYENERALEAAVKSRVTGALEGVGAMIDDLATMVITTKSTKDPYWEDAARELFKAYLWAMLEDSRPDAVAGTGRTLVTEDTFSFTTLLNLVSESNEKSGYFSSRHADSRARIIEENALPNANNTRQCVLSVYITKLAPFRESVVQAVTRCNTFQLEDLNSDDPVALFIIYRDEIKVHYHIMSLFVQDAYRCLIEHANAQPEGKRKTPFYFVLDEFGNFPAMVDFETTISACAGRNIFFILILQSYAQLDKVYPDGVAQIIRDNLNMHIFFGSNNPDTLASFSRECGSFTRLSPQSVLNGGGEQIDRYQIETIPLMPISELSFLKPGDCVITEANSGYVMYSRLERYYLCKEFNALPLSDDMEYVGSVDPYSERFVYVRGKSRRRDYDEDD